MSVPKYIRISGHNSLVRDTSCMGVINTNTDALRKSQRAHDIAMKKLEEKRRQERELNTLRTEVSELKKMVEQLLERDKCQS